MTEADTGAVVATAAGALVVEPDGTVVANKATPVDLDILASLGVIVPLASPEDLRAAFAYKQQLYAAILDENDYLYTVAYRDNNKARQYVASNREEAMERAGVLNGRVSAKPKKSGIVKLARALGITATRSLSRGLPTEPTETYSYVEYEAVHEGTGAKETGVGWCDQSERGGKISLHDVISTADTRAYNRAVLRLSGFGDVSAEEIVAGSVDGQTSEIVNVPEPPRAKPALALPPPHDDPAVMDALRAWKDASDGRGNKPAPKRTDSRTIRETRAKARRGDKEAATRLGAQGLPWGGTASDGPGHRAFAIDEPKIYSSAWDLCEGDPDDGSDTTPDAAAQAVKAASEGATELNELTKKESAAKTSNIPSPQPGEETITTKQAKKVSSLLKSKFSKIEDMRAWLRTECGVKSSTEIRQQQYETVMQELGKD